jgi:hypothetical protein
MENELVVKNHEGKDQVVNVIDIILDNETGKKYLFYNLPDSEEIYPSILLESETSFVLQAITEESEFELVEEILKNQIQIEGASDVE